MKSNKRIIIYILSIIAIIALGTYAWIIWNSPNNTTMSMTIGDLVEFKFTTGNDISTNNLVPEVDYNYGETTAFTAKNNANYDYIVDLNIDITSIDANLKDPSFKYIILSSSTQNGTYTSTGSGSFENMVVGSNTAGTARIPAKSTIYFKFIIYIDGNMENNPNMMNKSLVATINATAHDEQVPNSPDLVQGLIPVKYDDTNQTWVKADSTNTDNNWYDYKNKRWANAVLVKETAYEENISETNKTVSINNTSASIKKYTSSNQGVQSSSSINTFTFTTGSSAGTLSFEYSVSSESGWDKLTITLDSTTLVNAISGLQESTYSGSLAANTTYVLTATYAKDTSNNNNDDQAIISNIQVSNISGTITVGSSGSYPWTESTITQYPVNTYTSYIIGEDGNYTLTGKNNVQASETVGKYICSDTISTTCTTMYKITGYNSNTINKVDSYGVNSFSARSTYNSGSVGTQIKESSVLAYYVWIPRYKYKVWNIDKSTSMTNNLNARTQGIDIVFESERTSTGTISCNYNFAITDGSLSEICTGNNGDYYTHPAFTFGTTQVRGIWVGKFEISSETPNATNGGGTSTTLTVRIKPNVISWRYNYLSNFYKVIYDMQTTNNIYGLSTNRSNTDSHMLKNMEWGAVAYLTNSKYGRCSNNTCTEVTINNSSDYITGNAGNTVSAAYASGTTNAYDTTNGQLASTTGNIYGIYDMSGGAEEYVMANMSSAAGSYIYYASNAGSNYTYTGNEKYIDTYANGVSEYNQTAYNRSRLGDATGETKSWYSDYARFVYSTNSWFFRGGGYSIATSAGPFDFYYSSGGYSSSYSARLALLSTSN